MTASPAPRIGILHAGPRPQELSLSKHLVDRGARVDLLDVRDIDGVSRSYDCVLNRVYTSTVFEQPRSVLTRTVEVVRAIELGGTFMASGLLSTLTDHSKLYAAQTMTMQSVRTPTTIALTAALVDDPPFLPAVVKPDVGAFGVDCHRVLSIEQWRHVVRGRDLTIPWICQEYVRPVGDVDYRITVLFGEVVLAYRRDLHDGWPRSDCPSTKSDVLATLDPEALDLALLSSRAVGAFNNGVDLIIGERGPTIIENNPTFGFSPGSWKVELFAEKVMAFVTRRPAHSD